MVAVKKPDPYEQLLDLPEHVIGEVLNGDLAVSPRPASRHAHASMQLSVVVAGSFGRNPRGPGPGGWLILGEPELHLGPGGRQVLVPDLAGWRRERMPELPDVAWFDLAPDWVCEIASPSTKLRDRGVKAAIYLAQGVRWLWLVTPEDRSIEVFEASPELGRWTIAAVVAGSEPCRLLPFDAIELDIAELWLTR